MHGIDQLTTRGVLAMIASHVIDIHGVDKIQLDDEAEDGTYVRLYYLRPLSVDLYDYQVDAINQAMRSVSRHANPAPSLAVSHGIWEYALGFAISEQILVILNPYTNPSVDDKYNICDPEFDIDAVYESCDEHIAKHIRQTQHK